MAVHTINSLRRLGEDEFFDSSRAGAAGEAGSMVRVVAYKREAVRGVSVFGNNASRPVMIASSRIGSLQMLQL